MRKCDKGSSCNRTAFVRKEHNVTVTTLSSPRTLPYNVKKCIHEDGKYCEENVANKQ